MLDVLYFLATLETAHTNYAAVPAQAQVIEEINFRPGRGARGLTIGSDIPPPPPPDPTDPSADAGPVLPLSYVVSSLPGTEFYVSTSGSGSTCSVGAPCATLAAAQTAASNGDSIVVRSGTYYGLGSSCTWSSGVCTYTAQTSITKRLTIACYPGETCYFDGAQDVTAAFASGTVEGGNTYISYSPIPVTDGSGTTFATGGSNYNLTGGVEGVGKFSDMAFIGAAELTQVRLKSLINPAGGTFWVDSTFPLANTVSVSATAGTPGSAARRTVTGAATAFTKSLVAGDVITVGAVSNSLVAPSGVIQQRTIASVTDDTHLVVTSDFTTTASGTRMRRDGNHRLYLATADADGNGSTIEVSNKGNFLSISTSDVALRGLKIGRYSNTLARFGVLIVNNSGDRTEFSDDTFADNALTNVSIAGDAVAGLIDNMTIHHVSITNSKFLGLNPVYANLLDVDKFLCTGSDPRDEYTASPQSGCIKASRTYGMRLVNSRISDNRSIGAWWDETNIGGTICGDTIVNNGVAGDTGLFIEISSDFLVCDSYLQSPIRPAAKFSGSGEIQVWNVTALGGADPIEITADNRSNLSNHCADPAFPLCAGSFASNRWNSAIIARPANADWMPRLSVLKNSIILGPTGTSDVCNTTQAICINASHESAPKSEATLQSILHPVDAGRGLAATDMDYNVYANGTANIIGRRANGSPPGCSGGGCTPPPGAATTYTAAAFATWLAFVAGAPISLALDTHSIADPTGSTYVDAAGVPKGALNHTLAAACPVNARLNEWCGVGVKHFGALWK